MPWNYDKSKERIGNYLKKLDKLGPIVVQPLVREMDLNNLSEVNCREIDGAHIYIDVSNFSQMVSDSTYQRDDYKRLIRSVHLYQREISRLADDYGLVKVHFQGPRLHAIIYKPYDEPSKIATRVLLFALIVKQFVRTVFNPFFPNYGDFKIAAGIDIGKAIGTRNGAKGDREMLFIGNPANHAAKILGQYGNIRLTQNVFNNLPDELKAITFATSQEDVFCVDSGLSPKNIESLLDQYDMTWSAATSEKRLQEDCDSLPLSKIEVSSAQVPIVFETLSAHCNKRITAASVFADVSGFTRYIDGLVTDFDKAQALRMLHAIRYEMDRVLKDDYQGIRVQYQGDRVQGLFHLPQDDEARISEKSVHAAGAFQSSMQETIPLWIPESRSLGIAVGIAIGGTLASRLGIKGELDRICIGEAVQYAALCEEGCNAKETGITRDVYDVINDDLKSLFSFKTSRSMYVSSKLTASVVAAFDEERSYSQLGTRSISTKGSAITVSTQSSSNSRQVTPQRPYWHE